MVTVSLSMPHCPSGWDQADPCWKLIAGVIELSNADLILVEMQRIGWTIDQGRTYLQKHYQRRSRSQLNDDQIQEFLDYLKTKV